MEIQNILAGQSLLNNSIIDRKLDVCSDECSSAYIAEGRGHPVDTSQQKIPGSVKK